MSLPKAWVKKYLKPLVGCEIVRVDAKEEGGEIWPVITVKDKNGDIRELEVSRDEEGNGPGFLFGLPTPQ